MKKLMILLALLLNAQNISSIVHEYAEDSYFASADQTIVDTVEKIAQLNNFVKPYEILIPKKPALQINVWNRAIASSSGVNQVTGNPFIIFNPSWANTLSADEQTALISLYFQKFKDTTFPYYLKYYLPYMPLLVSFLLAILIAILLNRVTYFVSKPRYYAIISAIMINIVLRNVCINKLVTKLNNNITYTFYDKTFIQRALVSASNKQAMISVHEKLLSFVEHSMKDGEKNLETTHDLYVKTTKWLKNQS